MRLFAKEYITLVRRKASWHDLPATGLQLTLLRRLKIPHPADITKGDASKLIGRFFNSRANVSGAFKNTF